MGSPPLLDQIAQLRLQLDAALTQVTLIGGQPDTWAVPDEPEGVTEVWDRNGRSWMRQQFAGAWASAGAGWAGNEYGIRTWRQLVVNEGPLHRHPPAEVNHG
jgi:hypothetical protein